jgi:Putative esterase
VYTSPRWASPARIASLIALATAQLSCSRISPPPAEQHGAAPLRVGISFAASQSSKPLDGRMLLLISTDSSKEPRQQISDAVTTQQVFGVDVDGLAPATEAIVSDTTLGYPVNSLASVKAGDYWVQGLLHVYETFHRGDGKTVKLPAGDRGEGQQWPEAPGNLFSKPVKMHIDPASATPIHIVLDQTIPAIPEVADTKYVKHFKLKSERLTKFWGRPVYLGAILILPEGYDSHPDAHYPLAIYHGHFQTDVADFRETPPDTKLPAYNVDSLIARCPNGHEGDLCTKFGYERLQQEKGYEFYKEWIGPGFPRVLQLTIQHPTPYYDDSYAVNSENNGPYGDAITYELIPYVEAHYRGLGAWARALYGGSTGGWEALGAQVKYPEDYNGAYANCPDPIDFHAFTTVDIYHDGNAFYSTGPWRTTPRPGERDYMGRTRVTMEQSNQKEAVLGSKTRSGGQWDIWEAVFSPAGPDGYPKRIFDKRTGVIDSTVAAYWRDNYDLVHIMQRDWATLGPKLRGKITLNVGRSDNFFLNDAVYYADDFLRSAKNPPADAQIDYGARDEHCWSGDHANPNMISRLTYHPRFIKLMTVHFLKTAKGDTTSWRY